MQANMSGRRYRSEGGRYRHHLAFPRRPHQRPEECRRHAGLSECRDHGAGDRVGVLERRSQHRQDASATNKGNFANVKKVFDGIKVTQYEDGKEIVPGITSMATPGPYTGPHLVHRCIGREARDGAGRHHEPIRGVFMKQPGLAARVRQRRPTVASRRRAASSTTWRSAEKMPVIGYHFPFPAVGYVEKDGTGYRLVQAQARDLICDQAISRRGPSRVGRPFAVSVARAA